MQMVNFNLEFDITIGFSLREKHYQDLHLPRA